MPCYP